MHVFQKHAPNQKIILKNLCDPVKKKKKYIHMVGSNSAGKLWEANINSARIQGKNALHNFEEL